MTNSDKPKHSDVCTLMVNMESINLEQTAERIESGCF